MKTTNKSQKPISNVLFSGLRHLNLVEVQARLTWHAVLKHRIYSCPDTSAYLFVHGATDLLLNNSETKYRIPLNVQSVLVGSLSDPDFLKKVPTALRARFSDYINAVQHIPGMLDSYPRHRFYFLSEEPWPEWLQKLTATASNLEWSAFLSICAEPSRFLRWPKMGKLLWDGCTRGDENQHHEYPSDVAEELIRFGLQLDPRNNGPAIMAFRTSGGVRPVCGISGDGWHIHHVYDGTCQAIGIPIAVPHAVNEGKLFTHSAGLVAAHPVAHHLAHHSDLLKWILRREAFQRFDDFDPMNVFKNHP